MNEGFLIIRLVIGLVMAAHGTQKLFGWFGGYGIAGTGGFFESLGFRPGKLFAAAAGGGALPDSGCRRAVRRWFRYVLRRIRKSQACRLVPGLNDRSDPNARTVVS